MKKLLQNILRILSKKIVNKYNPDIVGITGSVGKTSAKEAIFAVLEGKYKIRKNIKNYNNEIGVPLTIIGSESGCRSIIGWFLVFFKAVRLILLRDKNYPDIIILEMGADRPGDIKYLTNIVPCKIGILTNISESHLEYFGNLKKIVKEKEIIATHLTKNGSAILNGDDENILGICEKLKCPYLTYGFSKDVDVRAIELDINNSIISGKKTSIKGISFKIQHNGNIVPIFLPHVVGKQHIYAALAAAAVGIESGLNLVEISESLKKYIGAPGRMCVLDGVKNTVIIDDTYNSSPKAASAALEVVKSLKLADGKNKYAVLGDMLELGSYTEEGHRKVGKEVVRSSVDYLVTVGERARDIARGAKDAGMDTDSIYSFTDIARAGIFIQDRIQEGDLILIKGSQSMRMEKIVKELMAEPLRAKELLVRQDSSWK
ncbi:MAG: UDP-N-acetylmuramoyl-tripeptide--D-alanyl-D-alanine ligase [bacterium]